MTPEHAAKLIARRERWVRINEWNLRTYGTVHRHEGRQHIELWDDSTLKGCPHVEPNAENRIYLREVLTELIKRFGTTATATFLRVAEHQHGVDPPTTRTERHNRQKIQAAIKAWAGEPG